jgi:hypothetical protein
MLGPGHNREPVFSSYRGATSIQSQHRPADHSPAITLCFVPVTWSETGSCFTLQLAKTYVAIGHIIN